LKKFSLSGGEESGGDNLAVFTDTWSYEVKKLAGFKSTLFDGRVFSGIGWRL